MADSAGRSNFRSLRNLGVDLQDGWASLHSHQQWVRVLPPTPPGPLEHLLFPDFCMIAIVIGWKETSFWFSFAFQLLSEALASHSLKGVYDFPMVLQGEPNILEMQETGGQSCKQAFFTSTQSAVFTWIMYIHFVKFLFSMYLNKAYFERYKS